MKKTLLALAVLASFAGVASAQTSVTAYGVLDMALQREDNGAAVNATKTALDSGIQSGSRLGFKGTEDLGGGLNAHFVLEMGMNADTGLSSQGGVLFGRQAFVGLGGGFGTVNLGRQYSPIFLATDSVDPFDAGIIGGTAGVGTSTGGILTMFGTPFRTNNTINYTTNNLGGFSGSVAYSLGEQAGNNVNGRNIGVSGTYANGPILITAAYNKADNIPNALAVPAVLPDATKIGFVGGTFDFKVVKAALAFGKTTDDLNTVDNKTVMLGATVPVGPGNILGSWVHQKNDLTNGGKSNQYAIGYTYDLSKRTNLYTSYSRTTNDANDNAGALAGPGPHDTAAQIALGNGLTDTMFNVGIRHKF